MTDSFRYKAFISYSHTDESWAKWLHGRLETYRVPRHIVRVHGLDSNRLIPIFRDRDELASSSSLSATIQQALAESECLIVICSPDAAESRWVNEEIKLFKRTGRADRVYCFLVGDPALSFPAAALVDVDGDGYATAEETEPLAADAREQADGRNDARLKIISGLLEVPFGLLRDRELRRKHQRLLGVTTASIVGTLVMVGLTTFAILARDEAEAQRALAAAARDEADSVTEFLSGMLTEADPQAMGQTIIEDLREQSRTENGFDPFPTRVLTTINSTDTARRVMDEHLLEGAAEAARIEFANQPRAHARILLAIGNSYHAIGLFDSAAALLSQSLELYRLTTGEFDDRTLNAQSALATVVYNQGRLGEAESMFSTLLEIRRRLFGDLHQGTFDALNGLALVYSDLHRLQEARLLLEDAVAAMTQLVGMEDPDTLQVMTNLGWVLYQMAEYQEAETVTLETLEIKRRVLGPEHVESLNSLNNLALIYRRDGRLDKAEETHREELAISRQVLGEDHPEVVVSMLNLARVLTDLEHYDEAELLLSDALQKTVSTLPPAHPLRASLYQAHGDISAAVKDLESAKFDYLQAREIWVEIVGPTSDRIQGLDTLIENIDNAD